MNKSVAWLLGRLSRGIARRLVRIYYPRIEVTGADRIPETGPVILCGNHPNSLIDPIVIGIACGRPVRFMAKAPLFEIPILGSMMYSLGMIPAYRGSDDSKQVRRNLESLDRSVQVLVKGHAVGIFPEGKSHDALRVEMVRSGVARIAVQSIEQGASGLVVIPMGLNYDRKEQFGSSVWVQVGYPIAVEPWLKQKGEQGRKAIRSLTNEVERRLKSVVVHIEEPGWEPLLGDLEAMIRGVSPLTSVHLRKQIADAMNFFLSVDRPRAEAIAGEMEMKRGAVEILGLTMKSSVLQMSGIRLVARFVGWMIGLLAGLLPAIIGVVFHLVPFGLTRLISRRVQPPGRTAVSFYRLLAGLPIYASWYAGAGLLAVWMKAAFWVLPLLLVVALATGVFALSYWPFAWRSVIQFWRQFMLLLRRDECRKLRKDQNDLRAKLTAMAEEYAQHVDREPDTLARLALDRD